MGERFASVSERAENIDGFAHTLSSVSSGSRWKMEMQLSDDEVYVSIDGSAWYSVFTASGPSTTLQQAYDGGGAVGSGDGRTISSLQGGAVTLAAAAAVTNAALAITHAGTATGYMTITGTGTPSAALTGLAIDLSGTTAGGFACQGLVITGNNTTAAKAASQGTVMILARHQNMRAFGIQVRNKQAAWLAAGSAGGRGSIFSVGWDTTDYAGSASTDTVLTGQTVMCTFDGISNVASSAVSFCGQFIGAPVTTDATATTSTAAGIVNVLGTAGLIVFSRMTAAPVAEFVSQNTSGTIASIRYPSGITTTLAATALKGLVIDLTTNVTAATNDPPITGLEIQIPATDAANAAAQAAIYVNSLATAARVLDVAVANTSGTIAIQRWGAGTTLAGATTLLSLDANTNMTSAANQAVSGLIVTLGGGNTAGTDPSSASFCARFDYRSINGTAAGNGIVNIECGAARTLGAALTVLVVDGSTNITAGANAVTGIDIDIPASSSASAFGIDLDSVQTGAASSGITVDMTPGSSASVRGQTITMGANARGAGLVVAHSGDTAAAGSISVSLVGGSAQSTGIQMSNGGSLGVSAADQGRLRYNTTGQVFQISVNTGAYSDLLTVATSTLQIAYNGGATIALGAGGPVAISKSAVDATAALTVLVTAGTGVALSFPAGGAATTHISGPSDQTFVYDSPEPVQVAASVAGNALTFRASDATAGSATAGAAAGGSVTIQAGDAKRLTSGNANGGDITLTPGAGIGTGTTGTIVPSGQIAFPASLGAITHIRGPADQSFVIGTDQAAILIRNTANSAYKDIEAEDYSAFNGTTREALIYASDASPRIAMASGRQFAFSSTTDASGTPDTGLARSAAGVVKGTDGSSGLGQFLVGTSLTTTNATLGLSYTRTIAPALAAVFTGSGVSISNTPTGTNNCTENGVLLNVSHVPVAGAGTITDTTTGISVTLTPVSAASVRGQTVTMGANATGAGIVVTHNGTGAGLTIACATLATTVAALTVTATLPTTAANQTGVEHTITTLAGSDGQRTGLVVTLAAGTTDDDSTFAVRAANNVAGTGNSVATAGGNIAFFGQATATAASTNIAVFGNGDNGNTNIGVYGYSQASKANAINIGVIGFGFNPNVTGPVSVGGYFGLAAVTPTFTTAALMCDNGTAAAVIFAARDNGTVRFEVGDGGAISIGGTAATTTTGQVAWFTGLGAITHILGPTDQNFTIAAGAAASAAGRRIVLNAGAGNGAGNAGGSFDLTSGAGVNGTSGSNSGGFVYTPGTAGTATTGTGGTGGTFSIVGRAGGTATGAAGIGGAGSDLSFACGAGGAASDVASGNGGAGGGLTATTGAGGASTAATGGAPGNVSFTLGNAGAGGNVAGATFTITLGTRTGAGAQGSFSIIANDLTSIFSVTNANVVNIAATGGSIGFFGTTAASIQVSGANLTNNVTAGGTTDTVDNITAASGDTTAADLVATRNACYQLARKLAQINDGLRVYGIFT